MFIPDPGSLIPDPGSLIPDLGSRISDPDPQHCIFSINSGTEHRAGGESRLAISNRALILGGGCVSKNQISVVTAARLFSRTAVAISIATRPFKFREMSVSISTRSFVFSIHSFD
jgi:hypothetical protein